MPGKFSVGRGILALFFPLNMNNLSLGGRAGVTTKTMG